MTKTIIVKTRVIENKIINVNTKDDMNENNFGSSSAFLLCLIECSS